MLTPEINEFAKLLVQNVRDEAIQNCDNQLRSDVMSPVAKRWREAFKESNHPAIRMIIADCVDKTISSMLRAVDQGSFPITFNSSNGNVVNLTEAGLGELCGWYNGRDGWRSLYSKERYIDDFKDLK